LPRKRKGGERNDIKGREFNLLNHLERTKQRKGGKRFLRRGGGKGEELLLRRNSI